MGATTFSIPKGIVTQFNAVMHYKTFVETGTFKGGTAFWAASVFPQVITIEIDPEISKATASSPNCPKNIEFVVGNSADKLTDIVNRLEEPTIFWLDGHWCNVSEIGKDDECPLISELEAISKLSNPTILIDDARAFLGPLPPPHNANSWPTFQQILLKSSELFPNHYFTLVDDVIFIVPFELKPIMDSDWQMNYHKRYYNNSGSNNSVANVFRKWLRN